MEVFEHVLPVSVSTNGVTVWVNSSTVLLGRFGMMGVDVHSADPKAGVHCLHCTHGRTNKSDWGVFKLAMLTYHGVVVDDEYMPERLRHARTSVTKKGIGHRIWRALQTGGISCLYED